VSQISIDQHLFIAMLVGTEVTGVSPLWMLNSGTGVAVGTGVALLLLIRQVTVKAAHNSISKDARKSFAIALSEMLPRHITGTSSCTCQHHLHHNHGSRSHNVQIVLVIAVRGVQL
jgi:hypothetical protein